jgi:putative ABC transport system substrate-binding protein
VLADPALSNQAALIARRAAALRLAGVAATRVLVEAGLLASYGPNYVDSYRRAASYVDRIIKGARPADLAVEQSSTFELVIHGGVAARLGVAIPPSVAVRADQVIR